MTRRRAVVISCRSRRRRLVVDGLPRSRFETTTEPAQSTQMADGCAGRRKPTPGRDPRATDQGCGFCQRGVSCFSWQIESASHTTALCLGVGSPPWPTGRRLALNPTADVPLPAECSKPPRFLARSQVERLAAEMPEPYVALVLVGAYGGLRWARGSDSPGPTSPLSGHGSSSSRRPSRCMARSRWARSRRRGGPSARSPSLAR
jgi:hypothetical protein